MAGRAVTSTSIVFKKPSSPIQPLLTCEQLKFPPQNYTSSKRIFGNTAIFLVSSGLASSRRQDNADNKPVEGKCFSEDENKDHSNEKFWLLCISSAKQNHILKVGHKLMEINETCRYSWIHYELKSNKRKPQKVIKVQEIYSEIIPLTHKNLNDHIHFNNALLMQLLYMKFAIDKLNLTLTFPNLKKT